MCQKFPNQDQDQYGSRDLQYNLNTKLEGLFLIPDAMDAENDFGCKAGQSDPIAMKLKLDVSGYLPNADAKFQIDISKHVGEKIENSLQNFPVEKGPYWSTCANWCPIPSVLAAIGPKFAQTRRKLMGETSNLKN